MKKKFLEVAGNHKTAIKKVIFLKSLALVRKRMIAEFAKLHSKVIICWCRVPMNNTTNMKIFADVALMRLSRSHCRFERIALCSVVHGHWWWINFKLFSWKNQVSQKLQKCNKKSILKTNFFHVFFFFFFFLPPPVYCDEPMIREPKKNDCLIQLVNPINAQIYLA